MSWVVSALGRVSAVAAAVEKQFSDQTPCSEPEEGVRQAAKVVIAAALAANEGASAVKVLATGCMASAYADGTWGPPYSNSVTIIVEPINGFLE